MNRFGLLPGDRRPALPAPLTAAEQDAVNLQTATEAGVLLKNDAGVLPLSSADLGALALIGPGARQTVALGVALERSAGYADRRISPYDALRVAGGTGVTLAVADDMTGQTIPADRLSHQGGRGLLHDTAGHTTVDTVLDHTSRVNAGLPPNTDHRWHGTLHVGAAGEYWLYLQLLGARGTITLDGRYLGGTQSQPGMLHGDTVQPSEDGLLPTIDNLANVRVAAALSPGDHAIAIDVQADGSAAPVQVRLAWSTPAQRLADRTAAVTAARLARKAVVFAWSRGRPAFALPGDQDALIRDVAAANPNTVVVLNVSQPVAMPWLDRVRGVLVMWWSGDAGGPATADLLLGRQSPSGRLPFTWGARLADYPATDPAHPERSAAGVAGLTTYSEGLDVGYRWFRRQGTRPLFAFGHGLTYSRFRYSGLRLRAGPDGSVVAGFTVANIGKVAAADVPQVYLGPPATAVPGVRFAATALAGFARVALAPGQTRAVQIVLPRRQFEYWSGAGGWQLAPGPRSLWVGASATDTRLSATLAPGSLAP